jgi:hypothetical protein
MKKYKAKNGKIQITETLQERNLPKKRAQSIIDSNNVEIAFWQKKIEEAELENTELEKEINKI